MISYQVVELLPMFGMIFLMWPAEAKKQKPFPETASSSVHVYTFLPDSDLATQSSVLSEYDPLLPQRSHGDYSFGSKPLSSSSSASSFSGSEIFNFSDKSINREQDF